MKSRPKKRKQPPASSLDFKATPPILDSSIMRPSERGDYYIDCTKDKKKYPIPVGSYIVRGRAEYLLVGAPFPTQNRDHKSLVIIEGRLVGELWSPTVAARLSKISHYQYGNQILNKGKVEGIAEVQPQDVIVQSDSVSSTSDIVESAPISSQTELPSDVIPQQIAPVLQQTSLTMQPNITNFIQNFFFNTYLLMHPPQEIPATPTLDLAEAAQILSTLGGGETHITRSAMGNPSKKANNRRG